ncbi:MAG: hypothetical protein HS122_12960 [Opitutaceae bacterium]|nr:hypothetical protein [Opitutaceae bacterium]
MMHATDFFELLEAKGVPLQELGIRDIGLRLKDALLAVQKLRESSVPILGGDVYVKRGDKIQLAYANWHCDPMLGEPYSEYLARSWATTETYIKAYPQSEDATVLFALVIGK